VTTSIPQRPTEEHWKRISNTVVAHPNWLSPAGAELALSASIERQHDLPKPLEREIQAALDGQYDVTEAKGRARARNRSQILPNLRGRLEGANGPIGHACAIALLAADLALGAFRVPYYAGQETGLIWRSIVSGHLPSAEKPTMRACWDEIRNPVEAAIEEVIAKIESLLVEWEDHFQRDWSPDPKKWYSGFDIGVRRPKNGTALEGARDVERKIQEKKANLRELELILAVIMAFRGESLKEGLHVMAFLGAENIAFRPLLAGGPSVGFEFTGRGRRDKKGHVDWFLQAVAVALNGVVKKVVRLEDIGSAVKAVIQGRKTDFLSRLLSLSPKNGGGYGLNLLSGLMIQRDYLSGVNAGVVIPGFGFVQINRRPDGKAGFTLGWVFAPAAGGNWGTLPVVMINHRLLEPLLKRLLDPIESLDQELADLVARLRGGHSPPV
jgi:hypothetical protein